VVVVALVPAVLVHLVETAARLQLLVLQLLTQAVVVVAAPILHRQAVQAVVVLVVKQALMATQIQVVAVDLHLSILLRLPETADQEL
jgi:hypothetical protein